MKIRQPDGSFKDVGPIAAPNRQLTDIVGTEEFDGLLVKLFIDELREKLTQKALDAIRPEVDASVSEVIEELKPTIRSFLHNDYSRGMHGMYGDVLINLTVENRTYVQLPQASQGSQDPRKSGNSSKSG